MTLNTQPKAFRKATIKQDDLILSYWEGGVGTTVIDIGGGLIPSFHELLANFFHVVVFEEAAPATDLSLATILGRALATIGFDKVGVIARGAQAERAIAILKERPSLGAGLVLSSPRTIHGIADLELPVLILVGTNGMEYPSDMIGGQPGTAGSNSHVVFVYDGGESPELERPEAVASIAADFLSRGERFIVNAASGVIHP